MVLCHFWELRKVARSLSHSDGLITAGLASCRPQLLPTRHPRLSPSTSRGRLPPRFQSRCTPWYLGGCFLVAVWLPARSSCCHCSHREDAGSCIMLQCLPGCELGLQGALGMHQLCDVDLPNCIPYISHQKTLFLSVSCHNALLRHHLVWQQCHGHFTASVQPMIQLGKGFLDKMLYQRYLLLPQIVIREDSCISPIGYVKNSVTAACMMWKRRKSTSEKA